MSSFPIPRNRRLAAEVYEEALRPCFMTVRATAHCTPFVGTDLNDAIVRLLKAERLASRCRVYPSA
jgi:hypothetical protein